MSNLVLGKSILVSLLGLCCLSAIAGACSNYPYKVGVSVEALAAGTQIISTASVVPKECRAMDFIYSNSLDQANYPRLALESWFHSLSHTGCIYLEMQRGHGKQSTSLIDTFSCEIELFPYVFLQWDMDGYIEKAIYPDTNNSTY